MFALLRRQLQDYTEIHCFLSQDVQCCREGVWTPLRGPRSDRRNNTWFYYIKNHTKKFKIQYVFALLRRQFQDYTEIHGFISQDV